MKVISAMKPVYNSLIPSFAYSLIEMHSIEPYYRWRDYYIVEEDMLSPFYGREHSEFEFTDHIYDFALHPQCGTALTLPRFS